MCRANELLGNGSDEPSLLVCSTVGRHDDQLATVLVVLVCEKVAEREGNLGYNALTDKYEDLLEAGVIDPSKVVRCEIQDAASVAALLLTSEVLVVEKHEKEDSRSSDPMPMI